MFVLSARAPRFGLVLWLTAVLLAALDVRPLNSPETRSATARVSAAP